MKTIDWNKASELGLIERINSEILHPLGLAMYRTPDSGSSGGILVSPDREFQYAPQVKLKPVLTKLEIHEAIDALNSCKEMKL